MIVYVWARCSASSLEPIAGLKNVLWVNVTTTTRTEAAKRKRNVPRTIIAILRWRLACSKVWASSRTFSGSFASVFNGLTESFLRAVLPLRVFVLLVELPLLPLPEEFSRVIMFSFRVFYIFSTVVLFHPDISWNLKFNILAKCHVTGSTTEKEIVQCENE